jgi:hypothetical protein
METCSSDSMQAFASLAKDSLDLANAEDPRSHRLACTCELVNSSVAKAHLLGLLPEVKS